MTLNRKSRYVVQRLKLAHRELMHRRDYHARSFKRWNDRLTSDEKYPACIVEMMEAARENNKTAFRDCSLKALEIEAKWSNRAAALLSILNEPDDDARDMERLRSAP